MKTEILAPNAVCESIMLAFGYRFDSPSDEKNACTMSCPCWSVHVHQVFNVMLGSGGNSDNDVIRLIANGFRVYFARTTLSLLSIDRTRSLIKIMRSRGAIAINDMSLLVYEYELCDLKKLLEERIPMNWFWM